MSNAINVSGPDPKSVLAAKSAIMAILSTNKDQAVLHKALEVLSSLCQVHTNIESNTFEMTKGAMKKSSRHKLERNIA